jgi:hypothetical protein
MAYGKATKIIFPFEISKMVEGAAEYLGASRSVPDRPISDVQELERAMGSIHDILGEIPSPENIRAQLMSIEQQIEQESQESIAMTQRVMSEEPSLSVSSTYSAGKKEDED